MEWLPLRVAFFLLLLFYASVLAREATEVASKTSSAIISSPVFKSTQQGNLVFDMGLIEPLREVHIAGPGGIVVADMDTLAVKQVVNTSTLLRLADADHTGVTIGTEGVVCTSSNFLPNNGRPVWVVSIRGAGVFVPDIGIYSFDAVSWRLVAAHSPLENRVWLPIEASDSRLVMDGGDVERSRFQYRVLYDTKTGFDAYPVPITQVLQTTGKDICVDKNVS